MFSNGSSRLFNIQGAAEDFSCEEYYAGSNIYKSLFELYYAKLGSLLKMLKGQPPMRSSSNCEQECERELEQEKEVETEIQIQVSHQTPASESDWDYSSVGRWSTQDYLKHKIIAPLADVLRTKIKFQNALGISWPVNIFCTKSSVRSLSTSGIKLNNYLRPVDALLCVEKDIILISERELNNLLPHFWSGSTSAGRGSNRVCLMNLSLLETRTDSTPIPLSLQFGLTDSSITIEDLSILALQVFNGETMYGSRQSFLPPLLTEPESGKKNAIELVSMRGNIHKFDKSDLDFFDID